MADRTQTDPQTSRTDADAYRRVLNEPVPAPDDPGGSHAKGYVAEPGPAPPVPVQGPVPLVSEAEVRSHVKKPDEGPLPPTGRSEPKDYGPNDRLMGSDR
jgi:hypothetical protein